MHGEIVWCTVSLFWCIISIFWRISHLFSYANSIETAVLLVIAYDIIWHRRNAIREIKREDEAEKRAIEREKALEQRKIRRERQEILRKHWQELQSILISLNRVASQMMQQKRFVEEHNNAQDATTRKVLETLASRFPDVLAEVGDLWGRAVAYLNVFPQPRDALALEVLEIIQEIGKTMGNFNIDITDETLQALAELALRVSDPGTLPTPDE